MKKPIIEIKTANESVTKKLIELGILFEDENGIHAKETCRRREKYCAPENKLNRDAMEQYVISMSF